MIFEIFLDLQLKCMRDWQLVHVLWRGFIWISDNETDSCPICVMIICRIECESIWVSSIASEGAQHISFRISFLMISFIIISIINCNNLSCATSTMLISIRNNIADSYKSTCWFNLVNSVVISISIIQSVKDRTYNISIIIED